jgi:hypothetical protein
MLNPHGIPEDILTGRTAQDYLAERRIVAASEHHEPDTVTQQHAREILRVLHRLNLIDHNPGVPYQAVNIHQLIQRTVLDSLAAADRDHSARTTADALSTAWPDTAHATPHGQALRANALALIHTAQDARSAAQSHAIMRRRRRSSP